MDLPQGNYTLRLYSLSGEYNINWFEISQPADLDEIPQLKQFRIFPNPSSGYFTIEAEFESNTSVTCTIFDLIGNIHGNCSSEKTTSFIRQIDYLANKPGIYFLNLATKSGSLTRKVIVN